MPPITQLKKVTPVKMITSWSYSRYNVYTQCPAKAKYQIIDKIAEPPNEAMARGTAIHELCERYIKNQIARIPGELHVFKEMFSALRKQYKKLTPAMIVEDSWAFTNTWETTKWNDWALAWLRIKVDCAHNLDPTTLAVKDWKTGKFKRIENAKYLEQLELYALAAMLILPHITRVIPQLVYLDEGIVYPGPSDGELIFTRDDIPTLKAKWLAKVKPMMTDKTFKPTPSRLCAYCYYGQSGLERGGPGLCKY